MSIFNKRDVPEDGEPFAPAPYNAPRTITASASRVNMENKTEIEAIKKRRQADKWQEEAWEYYDLIGEIKYSANIISNVLSRINIYPAYVENTAAVPVDLSSVDKLEDDFIDAANDTLYLLESGNGGTSGLLRDAALNLFIVGECYLVKEPARYSTGDDEKWQVRSIDEIVTTSGKKASISIRPRRDAKPSEYITLPNNGYIARLWKTHPRFSDESDSSMRGLLELCDELLLLGRASRAASKSRLNAGLLYMPDGLSAAAGAESEMSDDGDELEDDDNFEEAFFDALSAPLGDEMNANVVNPLVVRGPDDLGEKIRYITFERAIDAQAIQRADRLIDRILSGLDIPKDMAAGMSNVKYSNGILIEEQLYKAHIEPMILMLVDCLTVGFLRPALRSMGFPPEVVRRTVVWYDPSAITAKPSKAEAAVTLYNLGAIGHEALRRFNGFSESDAPTDMEVAQRLAKERGLFNEEITQQLIATVIPEEILKKSREAAMGETDPSSANALQQALGGDPAAGGAPAVSEDKPVPDPSDPLNAPPSDLLEP